MKNFYQKYHPHNNAMTESLNQRDLEYWVSHSLKGKRVTRKKLKSALEMNSVHIPVEKTKKIEVIKDLKLSDSYTLIENAEGENYH